MTDLTCVKPLAAVLYRKRQDFDSVLPALRETFSEIDFEGQFFPFVETDYYQSEMGDGLQRGMISFRELVHPQTLVSMKQKAKTLEDYLRLSGNRSVNIDVGYMDMFKVVLASFKGRSNKIYLSEGVWADMILYFEEGQYKTFMWGFPDFKSGIYNEDLVKIRGLYKQQLREERKRLKLV